MFETFIKFIVLFISFQTKTMWQVPETKDRMESWAVHV